MKDDPKFASANRLGLILGTEATATITRTLTHVLWALYDLLPGQGVQVRLQQHMHTSCIDLARLQQARYVLKA